MNTVTNEFASLVFDDKVMKETLSDDVYAALKKTIDEGENLSFDVANAVAVAMKDWAVEKGATHFTHWFQPLTGITAEKHDGFIAPSPDGRVIMEFRARNLLKANPTRRRSRPADFARLSRRAATQRGIRRPMHSLRTKPFASRRRSAPTAARLWTKNAAPSLNGSA